MTTSRERMLAALECRTPDRPPVSFMLHKGLLAESKDYLDFIQRQLDLGLDAFVQLPPRPPVVRSDTYNLHGLPVSFHPAVEVQEWKEMPANERWPILVKEYHTPAGVLRAEVRQDEEWPYGDHVPFLDDYIETRSRRFIVQGSEDLPALAYLLQPPTPAETAEFERQIAPVLAYAWDRDLLVIGGWGVGADLVGWVFGLEKMMYAVYDQPDFQMALLDLIAAWNRKRMEIVLRAGVDLYIKRAWYENVNFWSPKTWRRFIAPVLQADVELAHDHGAKFGYLITADCMPLLEDIAATGVDVIVGVDPMKFDLAETKRRLKGRVCLWGGINGHLTVERGTPEQVRAEVRTALERLGPDGLILSPVDNVRANDESARRNVRALIAAYREYYSLT